MLLYFEDELITNIFFEIFVVYSSLNLTYSKRRKMPIIITTILCGLILTFLPVSKGIFMKMFLIIITIFLPVILMNNFNIKRLIFNMFVLVVCFCFYHFSNMILTTLLSGINRSNNVFLSLSLAIMIYLSINSLNAKVSNITKTHNLTKKVKVNDILSTAIVDTGNKIKYKGKNVVVVNIGLEGKLTSTNKKIEVSTINSKKEYSLYYIHKLQIDDNCSTNYYYDVPAIIEGNKIILPSSYS